MCAETGGSHGVSKRFSGEVVKPQWKAAELNVRNTERLAQERYKRDKTVTPWFARTVAPVAAQEAAPAGQVSQLAGVPNDIKRRKVTLPSCTRCVVDWPLQDEGLEARI